MMPLNASLMAQVVNNLPVMQETQGAQVQFPVGELRSHILWDAAKNLKKKKQLSQGLSSVMLGARRQKISKKF